MAIASIEITCKKCGKKFEHRATKHSRKEANDYEAWARNYVDTCPECYKAEMREAETKRGEEVSKKFHLPEITEGTEKQIKFASDLRARFILRNQEDVAGMAEALEYLADDSKLEELSGECGKSVDDIRAELEKDINDKLWRKVKVVLVSTSARQLIDLLK